MQAIETVYNGYRFRSRLEARWAVFFDTLGVEYEYEPEGYDLGDGLYYLPDFRVKCWGTRGHIRDNPFDLWIEVKGRMTKKDAKKIKKFAYLGSVEHYDQEYGVKWKPITNPILILGNIPNVGKTDCGVDLGSYDPIDDTDIYPFNLELVDGDHFGTAMLASEGRLFLGGDDSNYGMTSEAVENAYDAARKARFEYGENKKEVIKPFVFEDVSGTKITIKVSEGGRIAIDYPFTSDYIKTKCRQNEPLLGPEHALYMICALDNKNKDLLMKYLNWVDKNELEFGNWLPF